MGLSIARSTLCASVAALGALLVGCSGLQGVQVHDHNAASVALRATVRPQAWAHGQRSEGGIEFGYERYRGVGTQALALNTFIDVGSQIVNGPDTLRNELTVQQAHVAYTHRFHFGRTFELEPLVGVANLNLALKVKPTTALLQPSDESSITTVFGGITPRWRFSDKVAIEARFTGVTGTLLHGNTLDASLLLSPVPNLTLRVGYADRNLYFTQRNSLSDVDMQAQGPSVSLSFDF
jgi:hypothetical protein